MKRDNVIQNLPELKWSKNEVLKTKIERIDIGAEYGDEKWMKKELEKNIKALKSL